MYDLLMKGSMAVIAVFGIIMAISPKSVAKKSVQVSRGGLLFARILGIIMAVGSVFALVLLSAL